MGDQNRQPEAAEQRQPVPWMAHLLNEPETAVQSGEETGMQAEIHHPLEMAVGGIVRVGGAVPADRHSDGQGCEADCGARTASVDGGPLDGV